MAVLFNVDDLRDILLNVPVHLYEGTCELCKHGRRLLSDVGGVLCCDSCRATLARFIKDSQTAWHEIRVTMDPLLAGDGQPGERVPVDKGDVSLDALRRDNQTRSLSRALRAAYSQRLLDNARPKL